MVAARSHFATTTTISKIGFKREPGSGNGHCVEFAEFTPSNGESEFCRDEDENWHDHVPADTLKLLIDQREGIVSTMSSTIGHDTESAVPGRQQMFFDPELTFNSDAGSDDSDRYVDFQCDTLADYYERKAICDKITNCDIEQVCRVWDLARDFKFTAKSYTIGTDPDGDIRNGDVYDVEYIMHYHSAQNADADFTCASYARQADTSPLSKKVDTSEEGKRFRREFINHNLHPSKPDAEFVKMFYPWQG
ncbi:hypothetical protein SLS61_005908 [Didymella pomorum]